MEKKKGTHLVLSGKVCGREEKRFDGECGNFLKGLCCSIAALQVAALLLHHCCTSRVGRIMCAYVKNFQGNVI